MSIPQHATPPSLAAFDDEHDAIQHFLHHFPPEDVQHIVYQFFSTFLLGETFCGLSSPQRAHLLLFYEQLPLFIQASLQLQLQRIGQGATQHYLITPPQPLKNDFIHPTPARKRAKTAAGKKRRRQAGK